MSITSFYGSHIINCAGKVGGILANNTYRGDFIYENLQIASNIIKSSQENNVSKLINLGSSCIYPRDARIPIKEEYLLSSPLEDTNEPYSVAKIAGIKMCESYHREYGCNFVAVMPTNLYGPNDNFDPANSHFIPALIPNLEEGTKRKYTPWFFIGVASFFGALIIWETGVPEHPWCEPDSWLQAHMVWHLLCAVATLSFFNFFRTEKFIKA